MNFLRQPCRLGSMNTRKPRAAVILRCKNNAWVIDRTLVALAAQTFTDFELVVVDSGSTDTTLELASAYPHRLIQIRPEDYIPGKVLNQAISQTDAELILFVNADCVLATPQSLENLVAAFDDCEVQAAFGRQVPRPEAEAGVRRDYELAFPTSGPAPEWMTLSLPIAGMRRSAWEAQPFYTDSWGSEDTHWGLNLKKRGGKIAYVPSAVAMHSHNYTLPQLYGRRFIEGEADAFIYGGGDSVLALLGRVAGELVRGQKSLPQAAVGQWGYFKGRQHGQYRQRVGSADVQHGQKVVLSRHESVQGGSR
jgi:rhamnosyltransferase